MLPVPWPPPVLLLQRACAACRACLYLLCTPTLLVLITFLTVTDLVPAQCLLAAGCRYAKFLLLRKHHLELQHPIPPLDVALMWSSHMSASAAYVQDMQQLLGYTFLDMPGRGLWYLVFSLDLKGSLTCCIYICLTKHT